jgi:acyl-CoA thioester hydrolase
MEYSTDIELRFADLDAYGHVNNAVFFTYLETARVKLLQDKFLEFLNRGLLILVVKAECSYLQPIELTDRVVVSMRVDRVGGSSFDLDYRIHNGAGVSFAEAKTVMVCFDQQRKKPVAVPEEFKAALG